MNRSVLYMIFILPALCFLMAGSTEKNAMGPIHPISVEITNYSHGANVSVSVPGNNVPNNVSNMSITEFLNKTGPRTISIEESKHQSIIVYGMGGSVSGHHSDNDDSSSSSSSSSNLDSGSSSSSPGSSNGSGHSGAPETAPAPTYIIRNTVTDVAGRDLPTSILTACDVMHYRINVTSNANYFPTNVTLDNPVVTSMKPKESLNEDGTMEPNKTWAYTGNYTVSQNDIGTNGSGSGVIENTANVYCNQFEPISNTVTVPITVSSALTVNETVADVGGRGNDDVKRLGDRITYKTIVTNTGNMRLTNLVLAGSPKEIVTKNGSTSLGVLNPGESWILTGTYNVTLDDIINNGGCDIVSVMSVTCDQVSPQRSSVATHIAYKYTITQPVPPPGKYQYLNTGDLCEPSYFVGADGHIITIVNNESAIDPTYKQLVEMIKEDKTNEIPYNNTSFVCSDAAERVHNNAEATGFRCAWVYLDFTNEHVTLNPVTNALIVGHTCNLFNTTDKGLIAIDCTGGSCPTYTAASINSSTWDNEVSLAKGGEYIPRLMYSFPGSDKLKEFISMGTIADFYIFW